MTENASSRQDARPRRRAEARDEGWVKRVGLALFALSLLLLFFLNTRITLYSDDFFYGTFFRDGLAEFWNKTVYHYLHSNGRAYVHVLVELVLLFDTRLFMLLTPILLGLMLYWSEKLTDGTICGGRLLCAMALGVLMVLALPVQYLRQTMFWISAALNYFFPVFMVVLALYCQKRSLDAEKIRLSAILAAVFAGASTEQGGAMSCLALAVPGFLYLFAKKKKLRLCALYPCAALAGYLTILLAPGSWARVDRAIAGGVGSILDPAVFSARASEIMLNLAGPTGAQWLLAAFALVCGLLPLLRRDAPRLLLAGLPVALLLIVLALAGAYVWCGFVAVLFALYATVVLLTRESYWGDGGLLLAGLASLLILLVTTLYTERTAFPFLLCLIMVTVALLFRVLGQWRPRRALAVTVLIALLCLGCLVPTLVGYGQAKQLTNRTLASARLANSTGQLSVWIDVDPRYRFTMMFEGNYFYENFMKYYRLNPDEIDVAYESDRWDTEAVRMGDEKCRFPSLDDGQTLLLPFEFVMIESGGWAEWSWSAHVFTITLDGKTYTLNKTGLLQQIHEDGSVATLAEDCWLVAPYSDTDTLLYLSAADFEQYFGLRAVFDESQPFSGYRIEKEN